MEVKMKKNSHSIFLFLLFLLFLVASGCSFIASDKDDSSKTTAKAEKPAQVKKSSEETSIPKAAFTFEGMMTQKQGTLMEEIVNQDLDGKTSWDAHSYIDYYNNTFKEKSETVIKDYLKEHQKLSEEEIYDYLIYTIGSGEYQKYYDSLRQYDPGFKAPDLPTGSAEQGNEHPTIKKQMYLYYSMPAEV